MKNEMNEIPTPESDDCYNKCVLTPGPGNGLVMRSKMRDLERRLTIARDVLSLALHVRGTSDDNEDVRNRMEQALTQTAPKP